MTIEPDNAYAVFVTYVEIYNNSVHDLLDEDDVRTRQVYRRKKFFCYNFCYICQTFLFL